MRRWSVSPLRRAVPVGCAAGGRRARCAGLLRPRRGVAGRGAWGWPGPERGGGVCRLPWVFAGSFLGDGCAAAPGRLLSLVLEERARRWGVNQEAEDIFLPSTLRACVRVCDRRNPTASPAQLPLFF